LVLSDHTGILVGPGSTAFRWAHASWDNAERILPRHDRGRWRGRSGRNALGTRGCASRHCCRDLMSADADYDNGGRGLSCLDRGKRCE
jgi:hypothetical protein